MANKVKTVMIMTAAAWALFSVPMPARDCAAEGMAAGDKAGREYLDAGVDVISYEMTEYSGDRDYLAYSRVVRERIRHKLEETYRDYYKDGDVKAFFIINSDGRLAKFHIDHKNSTDDRRLIDIAVLSLEDSGPFPPFPKGLYADRLPFSVLISFREK